nr:hypothetical protein [Tanacetum cinerariifolium]
MIDLGPLNYFLGIFAHRTSSGLFLSQTKYATEVLKRAHMLNCNPCKTPVDTDTKLGTHGSPVEDPSFYRSLAGALQASLQWSSSASGYCVFLDDNILTWSSKRQHITSRSSAEAEYRGVANAVVETAWVRNLLRELHSPLCTATLYADIFTKGLPSPLFIEFRSSLSVRPSPASTAGAY